MNQRPAAFLMLAASLLAGMPARADTQKELEELRQRVEKLEREQASPRPLLGNDKMRFFGYAEAHWNSPKTGTMVQQTPAEGDFHRLVLGWGYEFAKWIRFETEVEFEHAGGTIELEYAHLDFDAADDVTVTAGALLVPFGMLNEYHEPTNFWSVERPETERVVIPTTWQELGFGVKTRFMEERLKYRAYVVSALDAGIFSGSTGVRAGRGLGGRSTKADDQAFVHRIEYAPDTGPADLDIDLGASHYWAPSANHSQRDIQGVGLQMHGLDARVRSLGFDVRASWTVIDIAEAGELNQKLRTSQSSTIGSRITGGYAEIGYHILPLFTADTDQDLVIFVRGERMDLNDDTQEQSIKNDARNVGIITTGLAWFPVKNVAVKGDVEHWDDRDQDRLTRTNLGIALTF